MPENWKISSSYSFWKGFSCYHVSGFLRSIWRQVNPWNLASLLMFRCWDFARQIWKRECSATVDGSEIRLTSWYGESTIIYASSFSGARDCICIVYTHRIHVTGMINYIYHKNQLNVGKYTLNVYHAWILWDKMHQYMIPLNLPMVRGQGIVKTRSFSQPRYVVHLHFLGTPENF